MNVERSVSRRGLIFVLSGMLVAMSVSFPTSAEASTGRYSIPELVERAGPSVVFIGNVGRSGEVESIGSGFIVKSDGFVVTNFHVVEGAQALMVKTMDGEVYDRIKVIDYDQRRDLAVIKIPAYRSFPTVPLGDSSNVKVGMEAVAIGNPQGLEHTVTDGVISAFRREQGYRMMQISVPISPGSSGGPLFDLDGNVIGITTSVWADEMAQNLNFAVPAEYVRPLIETDAEPISVAEMSRRTGGGSGSAPPQRATSPSVPSLPESPNGGPEMAWVVVHDHGNTFDEVCLGILYVVGDVIGYTNDEGVHNWEVPLSGVKEVKKNSLYGSEYGAFHVKLTTGSNFNFVAVNEELQYLAPDHILVAINEVLPRR
jgi:S1-C subfamily serine protease